MHADARRGEARGDNNDNSMIEEETYLRPGLEELASHYKEILRLLGEDNTREGL